MECPGARGRPTIYLQVRASARKIPTGAEGDVGRVVARNQLAPGARVKGTFRKHVSFSISGGKISPPWPSVAMHAANQNTDCPCIRMHFWLTDGSCRNQLILGCMYNHMIHAMQAMLGRMLHKYSSSKLHFRLNKF